MSRINTFKTFCVFNFIIFDYLNSVPKELYSQVSMLNTEEFIFKILEVLSLANIKICHSYLQLSLAISQNCQI